MNRIFMGAAICALLAACSSDAGKQNTDLGGGDDATSATEATGSPDTDATGTATGTNPTEPTDTAVAELPDGEEATDAPDGETSVCNTFGCPCSSNADCIDELCVPGPDGKICTSNCVTTCPAGDFSCVPIVLGGSDPFNACVPQHPNLCKPCMQDSECKNVLQPNETALCLPGPNGDLGKFCTSSCATSPCPDGFTCTDVPLTGGGTAKQCEPSDGTCECRPSWASMNLTTTCTDRTPFGGCDGTRTCGTSGLTACDAPAAELETCNGADDDCDGVTDNIAAVPCDIESGAGTCPGTAACADGKLTCQGTAASPEACNGRDENCNGSTDEGTCNDGLACTNDVCGGLNETCSNPVKDSFCLIDGVCYAENASNPNFPCQRCVSATSKTSWTGGGDGGAECFIGGECYPDGASKPNEPCYRCRADISTTTWSAAAAEDHIACNDGAACTKNDQCAGGACIGQAYTCVDALGCTQDTCNGDGTCAYPVQAGTCLIDGTCYAEKQRADQTTCRVCDPSQPTRWSSPVTAIGCDDQNNCTTNDVCSGATCSGSTLNCDDQKACTLDSCNANGTCSNVVQSGFCLIGGGCYAANAVNPANPCLICDPAQTSSTWSAKPAGSKCNDGNTCTYGDKCIAAACTGTSYACNDSVDCTVDVCNGDGTCTFTPDPQPEDCSNAKDDDCDGVTDEGTLEQCGDNFDNDCDGKTDESGSTWGERFFARGVVTQAAVSTIGIYSSHDDGTFAVPPHELSFPGGKSLGIVGVGDFDADGFLDLIVSEYLPQGKTACSATGTCAAGYACIGGVCNAYCTTENPSCGGVTGACVDMNEFDGTTASTNICLSQTQLYLARESCPNGNIELVELFKLDPGEGVAAILDVNNDGQLDFVIRRQWNARSGYTMRNRNIAGTLAFDKIDTRPGDAATPALPMATAICTWSYAISKTSKDLDGDGREDLLGFCNPNGGNTPPTLWYFKGRGDGSFDAKLDLAKKPIWPLSLLTINDFDHDGDHDIVGGLDDDGNPGAASMLLNLGGGAAAQWANAYQILDVTPTNTSGSDAPGLGNGTSYDFNRDGYPDLLLASAPDIAACSYVWATTCTTSDLALYPNVTGNACGVGSTCNASHQCVACVANCAGRTCGSDGCGGSCGSCFSGEVCAAGGVCTARNDCTPNCANKGCGDNGCGGTCGECAGGQGCVNGQCAACTPNCATAACGDDGCGGNCARFGAPVAITRDTNSRYAESPQNVPPTAPAISILPGNPVNNDDLRCVVTVPSYDIDPVRFEYKWFRNGVYAKDVGNRSKVPKDLTLTGEAWECRVRATDGVEWSPIATKTVEIQ